MGRHDPPLCCCRGTRGGAARARYVPPACPPAQTYVSAPCLQRTGVLLDGQQGSELLPEQTEGGIDRSLGLGHRGGNLLKRLIFQQSRLPGVPPLLFSQPLFSQVPEGPDLFHHEFADPYKGIAGAHDLRFRVRKSARPQASCALQRQELSSILVHAGANVPELWLHPSESHPVSHGSFEAGEAAGHGSRQRDDLVKRRDPRRLCGCRSRGLRALESLRGQSPRHQHEREEQNSLEEALERDVHTLPPLSPSSGCFHALTCWL